jgi:DNA-binding transcriptional LysR family regulator
LKTPLDWNDLRFLLAVAEARTHSAAAKRLGVSQPTVGRRVEALEAAVGARLFVRTRGGQSLTAEGAALREVAAELARRIGAVERGALQEHAMVGVVRVAVTELAARQIVELALPGLAASHPELELELAIGNVQLDVAAGEVDLAVRLVPPEGGGLVARKLGTQRYAVFGAPRYLAKAGSPEDAAGLSTHAFVWPARELSRAPEAAWLDTLTPRPRIALRTNSMLLLAEAAEAGRGLAALPEHVGRRRAGLRQVMPLPRSISRDVYLVQHEDARSVPRVRVASDAIATAITSLLRGPQKA